MKAHAGIGSNVQRPLRTAIVRGAACLIAAALVACSSAQPHAASTNVVLVGDSLAEQAAQYLPLFIGTKSFTPQFLGGTAPCDWLSRDLGITPSSVVVISFTGNSLSPCMSDGGAGHLQGQAVVDKYRTDVTALIDEAKSAGASVLLVGQPVHGNDANVNAIVDGLNNAYKDLATQDHMSFVDAGAAVENSDGTFANSLSCLPTEPQCGPSGTNVVRNDDGLHFCPGSPPPGPCATYSSGAFRFAKSIADAVDEI